MGQKMEENGEENEENGHPLFAPTLRKTWLRKTWTPTFCPLPLYATTGLMGSDHVKSRILKWKGAILQAQMGPKIEFLGGFGTVRNQGFLQIKQKSINEKIC
jgi:hypothetical protein